MAEAAGIEPAIKESKSYALPLGYASTKARPGVLD
jgi:hypothetical protein